jgi:hypothetical protein
MNRAQVNANQPNIESLLAIERDLLPAEDEVRERVLQRARTSLPSTLRTPILVTSPPPRELRVGLIAAAAVVLPALCAAAFYAGYRLRSGSATPVQLPQSSTAAPPAVVTAPSVVVALVPVDPSTGAPITNTESTLRDVTVTTARPVVSAKAATEIEAYALELQVLQPARQAVSQRHFTSALSTIAEHQRKFPSGKLAEEREALRVKALVGLGRTAEAQRAGAAFRARFPRSALLGRIDEMLGAQK